MTIPSSELAVILLFALALLCWSLWPQIMKSVGKYRFELFYYDLSLGLLLATLVAAYTLGTFGSDITFTDNIAIIRLIQIMYALIAGALCNLGIMLLSAAISVAGLGIAGAVTSAASLSMFVALLLYIAPKGNSWLILSGVALALVCAGVVGNAYHFFLKIKAKDDLHKTPMRKAPDVPGSWKALLLSIIAGLFIGGIVPLLEKARMMELEMGAYPMAVMFAAGWMASTPLFSLYFLNLPVQGKPLSPFSYFKATFSQHLAGLAAGLILGIGLVAMLLAACAPPEVSPGLPFVGPLIAASLTLAAALGILKWKELEHAPYRSKSMTLAAILLTTVAACAVAAGLSIPAN